MDNNKDNIVFLIAYQRKTLRLLKLGLDSPEVQPLWLTRPENKK